MGTEGLIVPVLLIPSLGDFRVSYKIQTDDSRRLMKLYKRAAVVNIFRAQQDLLSESKRVVLKLVWFSLSFPPAVTELE